MLNVNYHNDCEDEQEEIDADILQISLRNFHVCPLCGQICSKVDVNSFAHLDTTCSSINENIDENNVEEHEIVISPDGKLKNFIKSII